MTVSPELCNYSYFPRMVNGWNSPPSTHRADQLLMAGGLQSYPHRGSILCLSLTKQIRTSFNFTQLDDCNLFLRVDIPFPLAEQSTSSPHFLDLTYLENPTYVKVICYSQTFFPLF